MVGGGGCGGRDYLDASHYSVERLNMQRHSSRQTAHIFIGWVLETQAGDMFPSHPATSHLTETRSGTLGGSYRTCAVLRVHSKPLVPCNDIYRDHQPWDRQVSQQLDHPHHHEALRRPHSHLTLRAVWVVPGRGRLVLTYNIWLVCGHLVFVSSLNISTYSPQSQQTELLW